MVSVQDSVSASQVVVPDAAGVRDLVKRLLTHMRRLASANWRGRSRRLELDLWRGLVCTVLAVGLAAGGAWVWTWEQYQRSSGTSAQLALAFLDRRLDAINIELARIASAANTFLPLTNCPEPLVAAMLQQSLESNLVRRFDLAHVDRSLRCGPQGERHADPVSSSRDAGLSIVPGSHSGASPTLLRNLSGGAALQATLDPNALTLPRSELPVDLRSTPQRIVLQSPPTGEMPIWDSRPKPGQSAPALITTVASSRHNVGVKVQVDRDDLLNDARAHTLLAVMAALMALAGITAWVWQRALQRTRLSSRLQRALRRRQFVPFVQPIIDLTSGRCVGGEVLMRWKHPERGILAPAEFIDEAERNGLILGMSDLTMSLAAHQLSSLAKEQPGLYFSFNITPGQLRDPGFAERLKQIFVPDTLPRNRVMLELTERDFVDSVAKHALAMLRADGWLIAIDDFGTGQSSLAAIESLTIDRIKVDRAFVSTIDEKTVARPVLDAIIGLGRDLQIPLIAEGVETQSQWDYLAARGVASAQGYLMARPMAIPDFVRWFVQQATPSEASADAPRLRTAEDGTLMPLMTAAQRDLWQRLNAVGGLDVRDRRYRLRRHRKCFVGSQAVEWFMREQGVSRAEAVRLGRNLLAMGLIKHVSSEHDFRDAELFYRLAAPSDQGTPASASDVDDVRQALIGDLNFPWKDHCRGLLRHKQCTNGRTLVDWIVRRFGTSRGTATQWAADLMRRGTLHHVFDDRPFRDDHSLFRLG